MVIRICYFCPSRNSLRYIDVTSLKKQFSWYFHSQYSFIYSWRIWIPHVYNPHDNMSIKFHVIPNVNIYIYIYIYFSGCVRFWFLDDIWTCYDLFLVCPTQPILGSQVELGTGCLPIGAIAVTQTALAPQPDSFQGTLRPLSHPADRFIWVNIRVIYILRDMQICKCKSEGVEAVEVADFSPSWWSSWY